MVKYFVKQTGEYLGAYGGVIPDAGAVEVGVPPVSAVQVWDFSNGVWIDPPGNSAGVSAERDRRKYPGALPTGLGWDVDLRHDDDRANIQAKFSLAVAQKVLGDETTIFFMGADNVERDLTPDQMIAVGKAVDAWISAVFAASWEIKATEGGIPPDYTDDGYWPSVG